MAKGVFSEEQEKSMAMDFSEDGSCKPLTKKGLLLGVSEEEDTEEEEEEESEEEEEEDERMRLTNAELALRDIEKYHEGSVFPSHVAPFLWRYFEKKRQERSKGKPSLFEKVSRDLMEEDKKRARDGKTSCDRSGDDGKRPRHFYQSTRYRRQMPVKGFSFG